MPRPTWKGYLRLALVTCPIALTAALTQKDQVHFHKLNRKTGNRLRMQMVDAETDAVVDAEHTVMGYEFAKGKYVAVEKDEIDKLKIESSEIINIERVVPADAFDELYWERPYLAEPTDKAALDIFATLREAMAGKEVVGLGRMVLGRREHAVAVIPRGKGMLVVTLRDPDEIRKPEDAFDRDIKSVKIDKQNLSLAETLIDKMAGKIDSSLFEDRYDEALHDLVKAKMKGKKFEPEELPEKPSNVVNLMDALKASLAGGSKRTPAASEHRRHPARRKTAHRKRA